MTLVDAGPLIALLDRNDDDHRRCAAALPELSRPLVTTWPAFTEASYILGARVGWIGQDRLWQFVLRGELTLAQLEESRFERVHRLMEQYRDVPMDLADATLVAVAEALDLRRVFTLDRDFAIYRMNRTVPFEIIPALS